jgi:hypothetical protein
MGFGQLGNLGAGQDGRERCEAPALVASRGDGVARLDRLLGGKLSASAGPRPAPKKLPQVKGSARPVLTRHTRTTDNP